MEADRQEAFCSPRTVERIFAIFSAWVFDIGGADAATSAIVA